MCVLGDFNIHLDNTEDLTTKHFLGILASLDLQQLVQQPMHKAGHILDLVITRCGSQSISSIEAQDIDLSDHWLLLFGFKQQTKPKPNILRSRRNFKNVNKAAFSVELGAELNAHTQVSDAAQLCDNYSQVIISVLERHAPSRDITLKGTTAKNWYDSEVQESRRKRRQFERMYTKSKLEVHRQMFREQSLIVVQLIESNKAAFYKDQFSMANSKETFKLVNGLLSSNTARALPANACEQALA